MKLRDIGKSWGARLGVGAALGAAVLGMVAPPASAAGLKLPMAVVARDYSFLAVPPALPAAEYDLRFFNISRVEEHEFVAVNLGPTCSTTVNTAADAKALLEGGEEEAFAACPGAEFEGAVFAEPGGRDRGTFNLTPGKTLYFCGVPDGSGTPHFELGMIGFLNVFSLPFGF